ncbi:MAG: ABC transporter substrate-binding protein [Chloroflexi bacterium]|nr:ABC transporter substrate-binding protein [Chloroflexota bacterium]
MTHQPARRRIPAWSVWLIIVSWLLAACGPAATPAPAPTSQPAPQSTESTQPIAPPPTTAPVPAEPVVVKLGWLGKPDTLNPAYAFLTESYIVFDLILSPLVTEGIDGKYTGDLAAEWSSSPDGLLWTFKLRDNLKWHDGTPLTAEDVAWSIDAVIQNPDGWAALSGYVGGFTEATAPDAKTVQIAVEEPIGNMEYRVSFLYALPRKDFESFATPEDLQNFANDAALGSGAFKLKTFDKDQGVIVLDANPDFHLGRPKIDQAIFRTFDNEDAMVQAVKVGDIDVVIEVPSTAAETVKGFADVKVVQQPSRSLSQLIINSAPADHDPKPTRNPALEDPVVKLAIAQAIDKQDLVDIVLQGLGKPGYSIIPQTLGGGYWYNPNIQDVPFSIETANDLLDKAGYVKGPDNVRAKDGVRLEFRLQFPSDSDTAPRVADLMTGWFKEAGIKTTPQAVDPDSLTSACCPTGDYDLILWGWGSDPDPDFMLSVLTSDQFVEGGWSDSGYSNPKYDELYLAQQSATDPAARQKIVWEMQQMVFDDKPYIVYWYADTLQAYRTDRFKNFIESPILGLESAASLRQVEPVK